MHHFCIHDHKVVWHGARDVSRNCKCLQSPEWAVRMRTMKPCMPKASFRTEGNRR